MDRGCQEKEVARISKAEGGKAVDIITVYGVEEEEVMNIVCILWVVEGVLDIVDVSGAEEAGAVDIITISRVGEEVVVDIVAVSREEEEVAFDIVAIFRAVEEGYQCIWRGGGSRNRYHCDCYGPQALYTSLANPCVFSLNPLPYISSCTLTGAQRWNGKTGKGGLQMGMDEEIELAVYRWLLSDAG